ncbi:MAG: hypothetical protein J0H94_04470 [Rhizobiales bacterium]|nr:hypothetical protein [Hyphomicrobiales bacterium]
MRLLIVASAALALLCSPALAQMGTHPGARAPIDPGENAKVPPGHTGYDQIAIPLANAGPPTELPADGRKRLACADLSQIQAIFSVANIDAADAALSAQIAARHCYGSAWSAGKVIEAVEITYPWDFSDGTHPVVYALHVVFASGNSFWVVWFMPDVPTS